MSKMIYACLDGDGCGLLSHKCIRRWLLLKRCMQCGRRVWSVTPDQLAQVKDEIIIKVQRTLRPKI